MCRATQELAALGAIKAGDSPKTLTGLFGDPQNWTGIYSPGGISLGYGNQKPSADNSYMFFWFHFKEHGGESDTQLSLLHWDGCEP